MNQNIARLFSPAVLAQALQRFGLSDPRNLEGFDSYVYECRHPQGVFVLKISHTLRQSQAELEGELDFTAYLARSGAPVVHPLLSKQQKLVEAIPDRMDGHFLAFACQKAPGEVLPDEDQINLPPAQLEDLFRRWGKLAGQLHRLAKDYLPPSPAQRRIQWYEEKEIWGYQHILPPEQTLVREKITALYQRLRALPTDADSYGLIHCDLHHGNFSVDENGRLTVFDFGSCLYGWFALDIAIALYYALPSPPARRQERREFAPYFMEHFMNGYEAENHLDPAWFAHFPDLLKYDEVCSYILYFHHWDMQNLTDHRKAILQRYREAIEQDIPVVDPDLFTARFGGSDWTTHPSY